MTLRVKRIHPNAGLPTYATEGSSGLNLYALEKACLYAGANNRVRTGIAIARGISGFGGTGR